MKEFSRLFCILVITTLLLSSCGAPLQNPSITESVATENENTTNTDLVQDTSSGYVEKYEIFVANTNNKIYPALAIHKNGERLVAMTGGNVSENSPLVTGAVWFSAEGQSVVLYNREDGLPDKVVVGEAVIIFSNYTENSVDLGIIGVNGETEILRNVPVDANDLLELQTLQSQTSNSLGAYKLATLSSTITIEQMKKFLKLASLSLSVASCIVAGASVGAVTFGAFLTAIALPCTSAIVELVQYFTNDSIFPTSTGFGLAAADCARSAPKLKEILFSCVPLILTATEAAIAKAGDLIAYLADEITSMYSKITFAVYIGESSYQDKTTICTCPSCNSTEDSEAKVIISEDGFVTGELESYIPFSGPRDKIVGVFTDDEPNNCNSICTYTLTGELTNDDNTFTGIIDETCTPGDCEFNNCAGIWTFSLEKK